MNRAMVLVTTVLVFYIFFIKNSFSNDKISAVFYNTLLKWNINYDSLEENKAGAACINKNLSNISEFEALGFSFQLYDIKYAKSVALTGCEQMKKKKNLKDCKCEIIIVNNFFIEEN